MPHDAGQLGAAEDFVAAGAWVSQLVLAETIWVLDAVHDRIASEELHAISIKAKTPSEVAG